MRKSASPASTEVKLSWRSAIDNLTRQCSASQCAERPDLHPAAAAGAPERGRVRTLRRERSDGRLRPRGGLLGGAAPLPVHVEAVQGGGDVQCRCDTQSQSLIMCMYRVAGHLLDYSLLTEIRLFPTLLPR